MNDNKKIIYNILNNLKGFPIYWAAPGWIVETHTIKSVKIDFESTDAFGDQYLGEEVVKIFIDDGDSYYIANDIGTEVFLDKCAAMKKAYPHGIYYCAETTDKPIYFKVCCFPVNGFEFCPVFANIILGNDRYSELRIRSVKEMPYANYQDLEKELVEFKVITKQDIDLAVKKLTCEIESDLESMEVF
jgi:hypothetical protein